MTYAPGAPARHRDVVNEVQNHVVIHSNGLVRGWDGDRYIHEDASSYEEAFPLAYALGVAHNAPVTGSFPYIEDAYANWYAENVR